MVLMKGIFVPWRTSIELLLTLVLLIILFPALLGEVDEFVRRSVAIQADQITGIINILQASPSGTSHMYILQKGECELTINRLAVNFTSGKESIVKEVISHVPIEGTGIRCEKAEDKIVYFKRCKDKIFADITQGCS